MDHQRARVALATERVRVTALLEHLAIDATSERIDATSRGDLSDAVESLVAEQAGDATSESLRNRLAAIERAESRLANGTYGVSVRSGQVIPDERLEADPAAELTVDEAAEG